MSVGLSARMCLYPSHICGSRHTFVCLSVSVSVSPQLCLFLPPPPSPTFISLPLNPLNGLSLFNTHQIDELKPKAQTLKYEAETHPPSAPFASCTRTRLSNTSGHVCERLYPAEQQWKCLFGVYM
jgi:hypothetical protein